MTNNRPAGPRQFLLRLWPEDLGNGEVEWRGKAQDIATGDSGYFRDWSGLITFLQKTLSEPPQHMTVPGESRNQDSEAEETHSGL